MIALNDTQERQLNAACFKIDHSCGLMTDEDMNRLRFAGQEWLNALIASGLVDLTGAPINKTEGYRDGLLAAKAMLRTHAAMPGNQHLSDTLMAIDGSLGTLLAAAREPSPEASQQEGLGADATSETFVDFKRRSE